MAEVPTEHLQLQKIRNMLEAEGYTHKDFSAAGELVAAPGSGKRIVVRTAQYVLNGDPATGAYFQFGDGGNKFLPLTIKGAIGLTLLGEKGGDNEKLQFVMTGTTVNGFILYKTENV